MIARISLIVWIAVLAACAPAERSRESATAPAPAAAPEIRLPWQLVRLENGLTLLMHPDRGTPVVGIEMFIRGGAREELPGQFGVAHLFEHYLPSSGRFFSNPENRARLNQLRRNSNAGAEPDFLRFYQAVAPEGLELALGSLADRLESDERQFTQQRLERDQAIVFAELRRTTEVDWNLEVMDHLHRGTFGADHPYGHSVAGLESDVGAATVELMREWHRRFATPANTIVLIAGNFDPAAAEAMVRRHFAPIPPGSPVPRSRAWVPVARSHSEVLQAGVPHGVVYLSWPVPGWGTEAGDDLTLLARIAAGRLQRRASESASMDSAYARVQLWELAGMFTLAGTFRDPGNAAAVEEELRAELDRLIRESPSAAELTREKAHLHHEFVRSLQQPAWRGGRTDVLGQGLMFRDDPDHYRTRLARNSAATEDELRTAVHRWLGEEGYVLHVLPRPPLRAVGAVDRAAPVPSLAVEPVAFPPVVSSVLPSGLQLLVATSPQLPLVQLTLALRAGTATDDVESAGRASLALATLARAPVGPGGIPFQEALADLGAQLTTGIDAEFATLSISLLSDRLEPVLELLGSALASEMDGDVLERARRDAVQRLRTAVGDPVQARERALACRFQGASGCNAGAIDGLGTLPGLQSLSAEELRRFRAARHHPAGALLIASGDVSRERLEALIPPALGRGEAGLEPPLPAEGAVPAGSFRGGVVIVDHPGSELASLLLVQRLPPAALEDPLMAELLLWAVRMRLMDNLRERRGWSYEIWPVRVAADDRGLSLRWHVPLRYDRTADAVTEIRGEIQRLRTEPLSEASLAFIRGIIEAGLLAMLSSPEQMNRGLLDVTRAGLPATFHQDARRRLAAITPQELLGVAQSWLDADQLAWIVAADRSAVEGGLRSLEMGPVETFSEPEP